MVVSWGNYELRTGQSSRHYLGWWRMDPRRQQRLEFEIGVTGCKKGLSQLSSPDFKEPKSEIEIGLVKTTRNHHASVQNLVMWGLKDNARKEVALSISKAMGALK